MAVALAVICALHSKPSAHSEKKKDDQEAVAVARGVVCALNPKPIAHWEKNEDEQDAVALGATTLQTLGLRPRVGSYINTEEAKRRAEVGPALERHKGVCKCARREMKG